MLREIIVDGERLIPGRDASALIASKSEPGGWHVVTLHDCDCAGFGHTGKCRHIRALASYLDLDDDDFASKPADVVREDRDLAPYARDDFDDEEVSFMAWQIERLTRPYR